ncbi:MAG: DinB family protein [Acidobacteriaceae bacterium]|nr:DinB family protein [Acidobacteriaceae bacterium]
MASYSEAVNNESARIAGELHRVYHGHAWLGPALEEILSGIDARGAAQRPIPGAHTIWELVLHISAWMSIARERLSATEIREPSSEEDWPPITGSWQDALADLQREARDLEQAVRTFPDLRLDEAAPAREPQTFYILLHGAVQHTAYHAGQIALLKKYTNPSGVTEPGR